MQALSEKDKKFAIQLHNQEVAVYCHDALQMSELREISRKYGTCASLNVCCCAFVLSLWLNHVPLILMACVVQLYVV